MLLIRILKTNLTNVNFEATDTAKFHGTNGTDVVDVFLNFVEEDFLAVKKVFVADMTVFVFRIGLLMSLHLLLSIEDELAVRVGARNFGVRDGVRHSGRVFRPGKG